MSLDTPKTPLPELTGAILAGGTGRRVGGQDKGWLKFQGEPLIAQVLAAVQPQVQSIVINANQNLEAYEALGFPVVTDQQPNMGPLGGILSILDAVTTDYALIAPVDVPNVPGDLVAQLWRNGIAQLILSKDKGGLQPLVGIYHRDLRHSIRHYLSTGERKLQTWCQQQGPQIIHLAHPDYLLNLNRPEQFQTP